jgi:hypothetical protein
MEALIQSLQEKVGLTASQAKDAASHFIEYFKAKLPASLHGHIDAAAMGHSILSTGSEYASEAKAKAAELLHGVEDKLSGILEHKA